MLFEHINKNHMINVINTEQNVFKVDSEKTQQLQSLLDICKYMLLNQAIIYNKNMGPKTRITKFGPNKFGP